MTAVKEGYKMTEVGLIPEDWTIVTLDECAHKVGSGITPRGGDKIYKTDGVPFIRSQNIGWGRLLLSDLVYVPDDIHQTFKSTEIVENDVFLNITGASIGRCSIANHFVIGGNVNQHVCIIRADELLPKNGATS